MQALQLRQGMRVAHLSEIPEGEGRLVEVGGRHLAVFHTREGVFATDPECPHRQGPLADGLTGTFTVMCPLHDRTYDLRSGAGVNTECSITIYNVVVDVDGMIRLGELAPA